MRTPRAKPRPIAGSPQRKGRYPRPARPAEPSTSTPPAHAALAPSDARKAQPRPTVKAEPAQDQGATLPRVEEDPASGVGWLKCIDGLHGRVSRWRRMAGGPVLDCVRRFDGTLAAAHPRTVERHRAAVVEWVRGRRP